ncbi:hypothetical protein QYE76_052140 [Lolium multiflorum]|uniref:Uncharacterized protein n=1 Tax=Lolium multiflorum TaxID=4521 RepID=A0AAD8SUS1_LOLMU|nr:hypothetical protein QYE76_052140 [Lolium multiflorum]
MSTSTIVPRAKATGHHILRIRGYSHTKAVVATGEHVVSCGFRVNGRTWRIKCYPNGSTMEHADWISVALIVEPEAAAAAPVNPWFSFSILDVDGKPVPEHTSTSYGIRGFTQPGCNYGWAFHRFVRRFDLESSAHLMNDGFAIRCDIKLMRAPSLRLEETFLDVPEPDLHAHLGLLLDTGEGADVEFKVGGETFAEHRCILAARSPVFKAELSSSTAGTCVKIDDMDATAFRALLRFIYTEALPETTVPAVARQLLAVADRYQVARLRSVCEDKLSGNLDKMTTERNANSPPVRAQPRGHHGTHRWFIIIFWFMELCLKFLNLLGLRRQPPRCSLHHSMMSTSVDKPHDDEARPLISVSTIVVSQRTGHHVLRIEGYARTKMMLANGQYVCSGEFQVGGHTWHLRYYPNGHRPETASYISMHVLSTSIGATEDAVHGKVKLSLPGPGGELVPLCTYHNNHGRCTFTKQDNAISFDRYVARDELEKSSYLKDDCFSVRCDLTVFVKEVRAVSLVEVPPPVLPHHLCQLLSSQERSDVFFKVGRKTFAAHRCVLAARSSVFKAELLGPMREHEASCIRIDDMDADVFRALLHFIYTDEMPTMTSEEATTMAQHLLVAADRYDMERLKLASEDKLCRHLDTTTAATTLALAEQHQCPQLKEAVFAFLCSSTANLRAVVATDGYEHLTSSCPSISKELVAKLAAAL